MRLPPPAVPALLDAGPVTLGAGLLTLPPVTALPVTWSDALFTTVSAAAVTGLVVVDPGAHFTLLGHAVIPMPIPLDGLGLMMSAGLVLSMIGLPIGMSQRMILREDLDQTSMADLLVLVGRVLRVVAAGELLGVAVLAWVFVPGFGRGPGLWRALFHTVPAFNNTSLTFFPTGCRAGSPIRWPTSRSSRSSSSGGWAAASFTRSTTGTGGGADRPVGAHLRAPRPDQPRHAGSAPERGRPGSRRAGSRR